MAATPTDPLWINASAGAPSYTANELRTPMALGLMYDGRRVGGRKGVRPGADQLLVSYSAPTITVQPGVLALDPGLTTSQGPYWGALLTADTFTLTAADPTNPRKDNIIARVYDHDEDASGLRRLITEYQVGTPAGSPVEPSVPASAIKLALLDVPASPGAVVVTDTRPWTVAPGGILPVRVAGDIAAGTEGRYRDRLDTNVLERDSGSVWATVADPEVFTAWTTPSWTPTWNNLTVGNGATVARVKQLGKTVFGRIKFTLGSTSAVGSAPNFTLPVTALTGYVADELLGLGDAVNSGIQGFPGIGVRFNSTTVARFDISATSPFTFGIGDWFSVPFIYEAA